MMMRVSCCPMQVMEGAAQRQGDHLQAAEKQESNNAAKPRASTYKIQQNYITDFEDLSNCAVRGYV